jgi:glycosyltransferase involved in cell wall biosynthesis
MKVGLFSPYLDTLGGGERYFFTVAEYFLKRGDKVDIFWKEKIDSKEISKRFGFDLDGVRFVSGLKTLGYDLLFFLSDGSLPLSFSKRTIIHFQVPFVNITPNLLNRLKLFRTTVVCNSIFTKQRIDKTYGIDSKVLYPPVDVENFSPGKKENIILGVGRFFAPLHPKKQEIMVEAFKKIKSDWSLVLVGGVTGEKSKESVEALKRKARGFKIQILTDCSFEQLQGYYAKAKLFWHATGFGEDLENHPEKAEHFGITTVEAMAAGCVPLVFSGGGQKEIIDNGADGWLWETVDRLVEQTQGLIKNEKTRTEMANKAMEKAKLYSKETFFSGLDKII